MRSGLLALFALASLGGAASATAHAVESQGGAAIRSPLCDDRRPDGGQADRDDCCALCLTPGPDGGVPPDAVVLRMRPKISRGGSLALWLGRILDARPDDLRSRAPPHAPN